MADNKIAEDNLDPFARLKHSLLLSLLVVIPLAGAGYWFLTRAPETAPVAPVVPIQRPSVEPELIDVAESELDTLMARARAATARLDLVGPVGDSAVETYLRILRSFPEEARAQNALNELMPLAVDVAESELRRENLQEADRILTLLRLAYPESHTIGVLSSRLDAAYEAREAAALALEQAELREQEQTQLAVQQALEAEEAAQRAEQEAVAAAETAAAAAAAQEAQVPPVAVQEASPAPIAAVTTPAPEVVVPAPSVAPRVAPSADELRIVTEVPPSYPTVAARRGIEGWVSVEFLVHPDGSVHDVTVIQGEPERIFDREAVRAVSRWRFEPFVYEGTEGGVRARKTLEFKLQGS